MKIIFHIIFLILFLSSSVFAYGVYYQKGSDVVLWGGESAGMYDANCVAAYYMTAAGNDNEPEQSGNGTDLTADTFVAGNADNPSGYQGDSRDWERNDVDHMKHADGLSTDITGDQISIAAWVKVESYQGTDGSWNLVVSKYSGTNDRAYMFNMVTGTSSSVGEFRFRVYNSSNVGVEAVAPSDSMAAGTWYHICGTYDGANVRAYVDGDLKSTQPQTGNIDDCSEEFVVGAINSFSFYDGLIDELIVFDRAITEDEIQDLIDNGIDGTKGGND